MTRSSSAYRPLIGSVLIPSVHKRRCFGFLPSRYGGRSTTYGPNARLITSFPPARPGQPSTGLRVKHIMHARPLGMAPWSSARRRTSAPTLAALYRTKNILRNSESVPYHMRALRKLKSTREEVGIAHKSRTLELRETGHGASSLHGAMQLLV